MKRMLSLILAAVTLLMCTACQPTPEEEVVFNKGDGVMEEKIFATDAPVKEDTGKEEEAAAEPTAVPVEKVSHWTETFQVNDVFAVEVDTDVEWGEGNEYHVEKYLPGTFTAEKIAEIGTVFFGGVESIREQEKSYDELLEELLKLEEGSYQGRNSKGEPIFEPYGKNYKKDRTAEIKAQMEDTPVESTYIPYSAENLPLGEEEYVCFTVRKANGEEGEISASLTENRNSMSFCNYKKGSLSFARGIQQEILFSGGEYYDTLPEPSLTAEEAIAKGDAFLASVGLNNTACSYSEKARLQDRGEIFSEGWYLEYAPVLKGTRGVNLYAYSKNMLLHPDLAQTYSFPWEVEYITLYVTEKGVESFSWSSPYELQEVTNENVEILSFEDIQESIRKYFTLAFSWVENPKSYGTSKLMIKRVVLTSHFVQVKDEPEAAYRVPVWAVFYISDDEEATLCENSVMLINALDGTMIFK